MQEPDSANYWKPLSSEGHRSSRGAKLRWLCWSRSKTGAGCKDRLARASEPCFSVPVPASKTWSLTGIGFGGEMPHFNVQVFNPLQNRVLTPGASQGAVPG